MRKGLLVGMVLLLAGCTTIKVGYSGILVNQYGTNRGVQDYPVRTGRVSYNPWTTDVYQFATFMQNYTWTSNAHEGSANDESFTVNSVEGAGVNFDVGFSVAFLADSIPHIFVKFRKDEDHIMTTYVHNIVRNAFSERASKMKVVEMFGIGKQTLQDSVLSDIKKVLAPDGIIVSQLSIIGKMRVDQAVETSINAVLTASQRAIEADNKVKQAIAESNQKIATARGDSTALVITAAGQSEANRLNRTQITPELIQIEFLKKWDGKLPVYATSASPFVGLPKP